MANMDEGSNKSIKVLPTNLPILLVSLSFGIISFLLPIYSKKIDANALEIGWLFSIFALTTIIIRPIVGRAIDKYGRKKFFISSLFIYALSLGIFAVSDSIYLLYLARIIQGIGSSLMWISAYAIAADMVQSKDRGEAFGRIDEANAKGSLFGALFGFIFFANLPLVMGWKNLFFIYALAALIGGVLAIKNLPETMHRENYTQEGRKKEKLSPILLKIMVVVFITGLSSSMISPLLLIYLQDRFTNNIGLLAQAFIPAAIVYSYLPSKIGRYSDKYGRVRFIALGLLGAGIVSFGIPNIPSIPWLVALWVLEAVGFIMASPALKALVADVTGTSVRGSGYGLYTLSASIGAVFGPIIGGWLYDHINHSFPFYLNGVILMLNAGLSLILLKRYSSSINETNQINNNI